MPKSVKLQNKALVGLTSGIGNAVLNLPLIEDLKSHYQQVDGIFKNRAAFELFGELGVLDNCFLFSEFFLDWRALGYSHYYSDYVVSTRFSLHALLSGAKHSSQIAKGKKRRKVLSFLPNICWHEMQENIHKSIEIRKIGPMSSNAEVRLPAIPRDKFFAIGGMESQPYIVIQPCAGDAKDHPKNIDLRLLELAINKIEKRFPQLEVYLLGGNDEREVGDLFSSRKTKCHNLIGETDMKQTLSIIAAAEVFVGPDSGLNHIAVALGTPSFSVWGPTAPTLSGMGYSNYLDKNKVEEFEADLPCRPCLDSIKPNRSRVQSEYDCPDFACMRGIDEKDFVNRLVSFIGRNLTSVED